MDIKNEYSQPANVHRNVYLKSQATMTMTVMITLIKSETCQQLSKRNMIFPDDPNWENTGGDGDFVGL
jgi:hypothetical protein